MLHCLNFIQYPNEQRKLYQIANLTLLNCIKYLQLQIYQGKLYQFKHRCTSSCGSSKQQLFCNVLKWMYILRCPNLIHLNAIIIITTLKCYSSEWKTMFIKKNNICSCTCILDFSILSPPSHWQKVLQLLVWVLVHDF